MRRVLVRMVAAWRGMARRGVARSGRVWPGEAWRGEAWRGRVRRGRVWRVEVWRVEVWPVEAWRGRVWRGLARRAEARRREGDGLVATAERASRNGNSEKTRVSEPGAAATPDCPYTATVRIEGVADLLFHRWQSEAVEAKAGAAKGSKAKKTDDLESYVYRNEVGELSLPGKYLKGSIVGAARFTQDPRSPRKSAMDLYKAAVIPLTELASLGTKDWDYEDRQRAVVQRSGITRTRPAMRKGWQAEFDLLVTLPEYVEPSTLNSVIQSAGRLVGIADNRPTYGRFVVVRFDARPVNR